MERRETPVIPSIEVCGQLRRHFEDYVRAIGPQNFSLADFMLIPAQKSWREEAMRRGNEHQQSIPQDVVDLFSSLLEKIDQHRFVGTSTIRRWLDAEQSPEKMAAILESINSTGGKRPDGDIGLHMDHLRKADDYCAAYVIQGHNGALLLYDKAKLSKLTHEEIAKSSNPLGMRQYGYKPAEGESFTSALLGYIVFRSV